jgi:hypothetical protein
MVESRVESAKGLTPAGRLALGLAAAVLVLDQAVKYAMLQYLIYGFRPSVEVLPFFKTDINTERLPSTCTILVCGELPS